VRPDPIRPHMRGSPSPGPFSDARVLEPVGAPGVPARPPQVAFRTQKVVDVVSSEESVLDFPKAEITSEEKARRAMAEAKRLASLSPGVATMDRPQRRMARRAPCYSGSVNLRDH
jgi:hypothetical protein